MTKSVYLTAAAILCFATAALANVEAQPAHDQSMGGAYTSQSSDKSAGVPAAMISEELMAAIPFAAPVQMPEAPSAAVLAMDLLAAAGLIVLGRKSLIRPRTSRV